MDGDGRSGAAVRAAVASLPGRPRPAPQRQGGHGVVPPAAAGAGRRRRSSLPLARPGPAVGPGGQRAGGVPLPRRPSVGGAAGGDRAGPLRTEPAATLAGWTTARDLAALPARRGGCARGAARASRGDGFGLERSGRGASAGSTGHMEHAMTAPSAWFQTGITSGVGSSRTWQRWRGSRWPPLATARPCRTDQPCTRLCRRQAVVGAAVQAPGRASHLTSTATGRPLVRLLILC
jgi:hypothetical protein